MSGTASTAQMLELAAAVTRALPRDIGSDRAQHLIENGGEELKAILASLRTGNQSATPSFNIANYDVQVDYDLTVAKAVKAGKYDWSNSDITAEHFPTKRSGKATVTLELVHFDKTMSSDNVLAELDAQGLRPAELRELLALGAAYPELQREFPIIELESVWQNPDGDRNVAYLFRNGSKRSLDLHWFDIGWDENCRFAAVRK